MADTQSEGSINVGVWQPESDTRTHENNALFKIVEDKLKVGFENTQPVTSKAKYSETESRRFVLQKPDGAKIFVTNSDIVLTGAIAGTGGEVNSNFLVITRENSPTNPGEKSSVVLTRSQLPNIEGKPLESWSLSLTENGQKVPVSKDQQEVIINGLFRDCNEAKIIPESSSESS